MGGEDADAVASHTYDVAEHLLKIHSEEGTSLDLDFRRRALETVTWHDPCHLREQTIGFKSRDLIKLTGAQVALVGKCSGIDGTRRLRTSNDGMVRKVAQPLQRGWKRPRARWWRATAIWPTG